MTGGDRRRGAAGGVADVDMHEEVAFDVGIGLIVVDDVVAAAGEDVVEDLGDGTALDADGIEVKDVGVAVAVAEEVALDDEPAVGGHALGHDHIVTAEVGKDAVANDDLRVPDAEVLRVGAAECGMIDGQPGRGADGAAAIVARGDPVQTASRRIPGPHRQ